MDSGEIDRIFERKSQERDQRAEFEQLKKEVQELREATTDTCPKCRRIVSKTAKHCHHEDCLAEFADED